MIALVIIVVSQAVVAVRDLDDGSCNDGCDFSHIGSSSRDR